MTYRSGTKTRATITDVLKRGLAHQQAGRFGKAEAIYRRVLARRPNNPHALHLLGVVAHQVGKNKKAVELIENAIARNPNIADYHSNLGMALRELDRLDEAEAAHREALRLNPDFPEACNNLGVALRDRGRTDEAENAYREAVRLNPDFFEAYNNLGFILRTTGRFDEAEVVLREGLRAKPDYADIYFNLAAVHTYESVNHGDVDRIRALLDGPGLSQKDSSKLQFALGRIFDQCGRFDEAIDHYRNANRVKRETLESDEASREKNADQTTSTFSEEFFSRRKSYGSPSESPVFIVGVSRSGKTLVESLIASHPLVHGAGELLALPVDIIEALRAHLGTTEKYLDCVDAMDAPTALALAEQYERRLRRDVDAVAERVSDTLPGNLFHLGLIALLFPKAKVIHCRRDPMDTCLAIYFKCYGKGNNYAYDLSDIGAYYQRYRRVIAHWRDVLPLSIHEVRYEDLVADPEAKARELIDFIGLDWDERCLPLNLTEPIHTRWVGRWRNYEPHLGPLKRALGIE